MTISASPPPIAAAATLQADLQLLLLIRHFENLLLDLFDTGKLNGTTHTCLGQEYIPVALTPLLRADDYIFSNHRGHGHYLARFGDPEGLLAEIMGKAGAVCHGVGGSQHIKRGRYLSTGVQGESLPVANGVAVHLKCEGKGGVAVAYIGDGTWGQGAVYEALNMAKLWSLPVVVVVENNHIAQTTSQARNMAGSIAKRAAAFDVDFIHIDGSDLEAIRQTLTPALARVRTQHQPLVIEFETQRLGPHSKGDDTRSTEMLAELKRHDWHARYQAAHPELFQTVEREIQTKLAGLQQEIEKRPPAKWLRKTA